MRLNQNIMVLRLEETHGRGIVLIPLVYKPRWGLSQQSLGSSASQNTVTSGTLHGEIMLCDPGGRNGWRRSQHWDVSRPCFFFFFSFRFPSFLPCMACHIHSACTRRLTSMYVGGCGSNSPFSSLLSSAISTSWSHLLLKPVIHPSSLYAPQNQPQAQPRPRDPCPHRGSWIMYGGIQWDGGFATAPAMTYITPVALSIPCDFPVCGQMYPHVRTWSLAKKKTIQSVKRADISTDAWL